MKPSRKISLVSLSLVLVVMLSFISDMDLTAQFKSGARKRNVNIQTFVLSSFEDAKQWKVEYSMFTTKKFNSTTKSFEVNKEKCAWKTFKGRPWGVRGKYIEKEEQNVLAVKGSFDRKGYNWIEVAPVKPLPMIGKVQAIDLWVWGGNFRYRLEVHVEDYQGFNHVIDAGWLNYVGWRNLRLKVPQYIPQGEKYIPRLKTLLFKKFMLFANPGERCDIFYIYFDRMQIQTDVYLERFDGDDMVKQGFKTKWMHKQDVLKTHSK